MTRRQCWIIYYGGMILLGAMLVCEWGAPAAWAAAIGMLLGYAMGRLDGMLRQ